MMEARFLRTVGRMTAGDNRKFIGHSIGYLFMRSFAMSEAVYDAMRCRNFSGKTAAVSGTRISGTDILFAVSNLLIMMIVLMGERIF
jgi:cobalt/nickel transport system permease protein